MSNASTNSFIRPSPAPASGSGPFSSANALTADLTFGTRTIQVGPLAPVSGTAPPAYDPTKNIRHWQTTVNLQPGSPLRPTVQFQEGNVKTNAASSGIGIDSESASAQVNIGSSTFLLTDNPSAPLGIAGILGLSFSATGIQASASFSHVFGSSQNFVTGDASFGSLTISGALIGKTLTFSGDAAPNTVLFSSPTVTITLDKQVVTDLITTGSPSNVTPVGITTEAIDISFHNASFLGTHLSGDIIIGLAAAGTT